MKKIRIIAMLICIVSIICVLALTANAKFWDENPFTDVKSTHWYYDAVRICNENDIFSGTAADKYSPSVKMTRAMLVKALANLDGYTEEFKGTTPFTDVKSNHWFASAVEWAYTNGITSGKTDTVFAPNENITREQLAAMLYRYASYKGMTIENSKSITEFPDAGKVASYAVANFEWAYGNGIINGSKSGDTLYLNPRNPATRAECATMFSKYLYLEPIYEINGNDLSLYNIVYSENEIESVAKAANDLSKYIEHSVGISLPVVTDSVERTDYEILVGKTNREVKADISTLASDTEFICTVEDNTLVLMGTDDTTEFNTVEDKSHHNVDGSKNAVYYFLEKEFGFEFYYDGEGTLTTPDPVISLDNGYKYIDGPALETIGMYITDAGAECYLHNDYYKEWGCGMPHQLVNLIEKGEGDTNNTMDNICYSDPENKEKLITNIRALLARKPELNLIGLIQSDSDGYCKCTDCGAIYREHGRAGTLIQLVNLAAETFETEAPDVRFATWAYGWSATPPKTDLGYHKNVILYYNTIKLCPCHEYTDATCKGNKDSASTLKTWAEKAGKLYLWEHTGSFGDAMVPAFDLDSIRANAEYFYNNGVKGVFLNGRTGNASDLYVLRAYLYTQVYRDPTMSEEEYSYRMNGFLKTYFGDGYTYIRQYIDALNTIGNESCTGTHVPITATYNFDLITEEGAKINDMWDKAEAAAKTEDQLDRVKMHRLSWTYLWQSARYEKDYTNGTNASREAYKAVSQELYEEILSYNVKWDGFQEEPSGDLTKPPYQW
ncbi:MAG: DUF4838 domain-containing protein [Clostridia bacterium]|nr:DUF4838 domain-containing protein [Clostridia bacterium]